MRPMPSPAEVRQLMTRYAPRFAEDEPHFLGHGEDFWAYRAGSHVVRVAKGSRGRVALEVEQRLLPELARTLPVTFSNDFGAGLGHFVRTLHSFSVERAGALGVPNWSVSRHGRNEKVCTRT
jgi:hypothetical protein